jgi:hypothetical protein
MRRSENKNREAIDRAEPLIQTLPRLNALGGRAIRSQISIVIPLGDDREIAGAFGRNLFKLNKFPRLPIAGPLVGT